MGVKATIVMPLATPSLKWKNVKRMGTEVVLFGNDFDEAKIECKRLAKVSDDYLRGASLPVPSTPGTNRDRNHHFIISSASHPSYI